MLLEIRLYGGLTCQNEEMTCFGSTKFTLEVHEGASLKEIHELLQLSKKNLVSIVNGSAQPQEFVVPGDCRISIFPSMGDRNYNPFTKI